MTCSRYKSSQSKGSGQRHHFRTFMLIQNLTFIVQRQENIAPAYSSSSLDFSTSTRVLLLLLLLGYCQPSSSAALPTQAAPRWQNPCAGGSATVVDSVEDMVTTTTDEARDAFAMLSGRSTVLKHLVNSLKNDYILSRFREARYAEDWVNSGLEITGSPSWTARYSNMRETLLACYENLARLAALTQLVRVGEQSAATTENHHFASRFEEIEDHHEAGLYVLLCSLHTVMESWGIQAMSQETAAQVASINFEAVQSNAVRHGRDYLVLLVLENSADQLSSSFDRLVGQMAPQTTPASTQ